MEKESNTPEIQHDSGDENVKSREQMRLEIIKKLTELGVKNCPDEVIDRLLIISENSKFNIDSEMICEAFGNVLSAFETRNPETGRLTPKQKEDGLLAAYLHDIGKSGPLSANIDCGLSVIKLFSIKDAYPKDRVKDILDKNFPDDSERMMENLKSAGVSAEMSMREFWDLHAWWTHGILVKYPDVFSERVVIIASSHHINAGINPCKISEDEIPYDSKVIGALEGYVDFLEERILMAIDKYQAALVRGSIDHERAIIYLREVFKKKDDVTATIINIIDELGKTNSLFPKTKDKYGKQVVK